MSVLIWICQGFLALVFMYSGLCKASQSKEWLVNKGQTGVEGLSLLLIRFIGLLEVAAVVGLFLPWLTKVLPVLTPVSALGLGLIMLPAAIIHFKRNEYRSVVLNVFILSICVLLAWVRFKEL